MKKIANLQSVILLFLCLMFFSCRDSSTNNGIAPYSGEGFGQNISWVNYNVPDTLMIDSIYKTTTRLKTNYKVIGDIYFIELDKNIVLNVVGAEELVDKPKWNYDEKYKLRFNTDNENNFFDFETEVQVKKDYWNDLIDGQYYSLYLQIDSIYIDSDTLYRSSLGADSLNYPFLLPERRWYVRGQEMYDSTHSEKTTDLEFLSQYFTGEVIQIHYTHNQLFNDTIYIKRGQ